ncbi:hypothetical protein Sango_1871600 [Sesamum angolense]|uniref:Transposase n=1 Tax=Sesamum angolense TaxID=2727404 RepID=A0AAE2BQM7_9LAMI|nr:hypothetical protein Sango_1871600 [Sesamum angolense]
MSRNAFGRLCQLLETAGGLRGTRHVSVIEQVAIFLSVIAHHKKNYVTKHDFIRSGKIINKHFHSILKVVLRLSSILLARPLPVDDECQDSHWRWFKGCLGALDGTYIEVHVPDSDKGRYRSRKGQISTNVLGLCNLQGMFIYVLSCWKGSAVDGRVLRDVVHRPAGIKVPTGNYYLSDNRYGNVEGFLTPYQGVREIPDDPLEGELPNEVDMSVDHGIEVVSTLDATPQWTSWRDALATDITGWKCENGFRAGYLNQLEAIMCKQLPNINIRAEPHINSKIHIWKKHYGTLMGMMGKSGFGWDDSRSMITVDSQDVWDEYCKIDSSARTMQYKSWPFLPAWREIFGKDRAVGYVIVEAHPKVNEADTDADTETHGYYVPTTEWCPGVGYVENDSGALGDIQENVNRSIPGIDLNEQILISDRLVENPKKMDLFFSLPDDARACMVGLMPSGKTAVGIVGYVFLSGSVWRICYMPA